jgi:hypothetical protein
VAAAERLVDILIGVALLAGGVYLATRPAQGARIIQDYYRRRRDLGTAPGWLGKTLFLPGRRTSLAMFALLTAFALAIGLAGLYAGISGSAALSHRETTTHSSGDESIAVRIILIAIGTVLAGAGAYIVSRPRRHARAIQDFYRRRNEHEMSRGWPAESPFLPSPTASLVILLCVSALILLMGVEALVVGLTGSRTGP